MPILTLLRLVGWLLLLVSACFDAEKRRTCMTNDIDNSDTGVEPEKEFSLWFVTSMTLKTAG